MANLQLSSGRIRVVDAPLALICVERGDGTTGPALRAPGNPPHPRPGEPNASI